MNLLIVHGVNKYWAGGLMRANGPRIITLAAGPVPMRSEDGGAAVHALRAALLGELVQMNVRFPGESASMRKDPARAPGPRITEKGIEL